MDKPQRPRLTLVAGNRPERHREFLSAICRGDIATAEALNARMTPAGQLGVVSDAADPEPGSESSEASK